VKSRVREGRQKVRKKSNSKSVSVEINENLCKGCEICIEFCPTDVFEKSGKLNRKGYSLPVIAREEDCTGCCICELMCPEFGIIINVSSKPDEVKAG
jgi:2-oxoglutarate ferredoxin oxidoreductase subunit delta